MSAERRPTLALALDVGTTRIKAARLDEAGRLVDMISRPTPELAGDGLVREGEPDALCDAVDCVLAESLTAIPAHERSGLPLALAWQRSTFVLWRRADGRAVTPLVSWQDRSAAPWCRAHAADEPRARELSGLPLSPHYAGPKLALRFERDRALLDAAHAGDLCFGTLDAWLTWHWTGGRTHATDLGMAARTQMVDVRAGDWSPELLGLFGVPRAVLPEIRPTCGAPLELTDLPRAPGGPALAGVYLAASVADQAAGLAAVAGDDPRTALVNLGTGSFVLRATGPEFRPLAGYLAGPLFARADPSRNAVVAGAPNAGGARAYALEGTINAGGRTADACAPPPTAWPDAQAADDDAFCLPDEDGIGAPYWIAERGLTFSPAARALPDAGRRRVVIEGLLFRVRGILEDLSPGERLERVLVSGGLARDPAVACGLAALLERPVEVVREQETTLLGAARLATQSRTSAPGTAGGSATRRIDPDAGLGWLPAKGARWIDWLATELA